MYIHIINKKFYEKIGLKQVPARVLWDGTRREVFMHNINIFIKLIQLSINILSLGGYKIDPKKVRTYVVPNLSDCPVRNHFI